MVSKNFQKMKMSRKVKRKQKASAPKVTTYDTYDGKVSKKDRIDFVATALAFLVCWLMLGGMFTLWLSDIGLDIILAIILGIIGGFIASVLAWLICRSGFSPMM